MKLKPAILALAAASLGVSASLGQTTLTLGDIQITGLTSDANDSFGFVLWKPIAANTVIRFTDNSFTNAAGTTFLSGTEQDMSITFTSAVAAGSVIRYEDTVGLILPSGVTAISSGSLSGTSASGDQVFAYQGNAVSGTGFSGRTLLYGFNIAETSWVTSGADSNNSFLPTAISGIDANLDTGNFENADYTGVRTGLTTAVYRAAVSNLANFTTQSDTRFNLSTTGFTSTSSASLHWDANGTTAGNGGAGTWDTTTQSRFKDGASGTTYLHWVNSTAGNDHTAVFSGTVGAVSIGASGVTASGLTFNVDGYTIQSNTLTLAGATPTISVTTAGHSANISSTLAGSTGLAKSGAGILNITGTNSINIGATSVTAGTLNVGVGGTGTLTSAVTVSGAGTKLGGSGTITGNVGIGSGSILAAGNSVGKLTTEGTTTLNSGSIFEWELGSFPATTGRGTAYDAINTTALAGSGAIFRVILSGTQDFTASFWDTNRTWSDIFTNVAGDTALGIASIFSSVQYYNVTNGVLTSPATTQGSFTFSSTNLTWTAVPEPTSALAGLLITAGLLRRRRVA